MPQAAVAELALDDDERDAFARELDGMGVPELMRREAPPDARVGALGSHRDGSAPSTTAPTSNS
jgi:hypothetical protein